MQIPFGRIVATRVQLAAGTVHDNVMIDPLCGASGAQNPMALW